MKIAVRFTIICVRFKEVMCDFYKLVVNKIDWPANRTGCLKIVACSNLDETIIPMNVNYLRLQAT